jgi:hypothetical protein
LLPEPDASSTVVVVPVSLKLYAATRPATVVDVEEVVEVEVLDVEVVEDVEVDEVLLVEVEVVVGFVFDVELLDDVEVLEVLVEDVLLVVVVGAVSGAIVRYDAI